jgi:predicted negative regulator of RcsB-dependent stress response
VELYLLIDSERHGPYTLDEVREYLTQPGTGEVSVAVAGGPWAPPRKIRELRDAWDRGRAAERAPALETRPRPSSQPFVADRPKARATRATPDAAPTTPAAAPQVVVSSQMPGARGDEVPWRPGNIDDLTRGAGSSLDDAATVVRPELTLDDVAEFLPSPSPVGAAPVPLPPSVAQRAQIIAGSPSTSAASAARRRMIIAGMAASALALALTVGILLLTKRSPTPTTPTTSTSATPVSAAVGPGSAAPAPGTPTAPPPQPASDPAQPVGSAPSPPDASPPTGLPSPGALPEPPAPGGDSVTGGGLPPTPSVPATTELPVFGPWIELPCDSAAADERIKQARAEQQAGNVAEAIALYQEASEIDPNDPVSHSSIAYLYLRMGQAADALEPALAALARAPEGATHWMRLGDVYAKLDDQTRALAAYDQALTFNPTSEAVILRKGDLLWKVGDQTGARAAWQPACTAGSAAACQRVQQGAPVSGADRASP